MGIIKLLSIGITLGYMRLFVNLSAEKLHLDNSYTQW